MHAIYDLAPDCGADRVLLVMLPGAMDRAQDLMEQGLCAALRERGLPVDVVAVDAHVDYYFERTVIECLAADIIAPARDLGYKRIWLLGISIGGMGSMAYVREHAADIEGVVLLAPFLGARGLIAEVMRAGGLNQWTPGDIPPGDDERALVAWLRTYRSADPALPAIFLGYGKGDRFAPASTMLAAQLPASRVVAVEGGHDWQTWRALWQQLLDKGLFSN